MKKKYVVLLMVVVMIFTAIPSFAFASAAKTSLDTPELTSYANKDATITSEWTKVKDAEKYQLYRAQSKSGKYINVWLTWQNSYKDAKVKAGKTYYYKIRAFKTEKGKKVYSKFSPVVAVKAVKKDTPETTLSAPELTSYANKDATITSEWTKVKGAEKYQLYRTESKGGKYINVWLTWQNSYKDADVKANKTYYYKVRAYKTENGKKVYSKCSSVVAVKAQAK